MYLKIHLENTFAPNGYSEIGAKKRRGSCGSKLFFGKVQGLRPRRNDEPYLPEV